MWDIEVHVGQNPGLWPQAWEDVTGRLRNDPINPTYGRSDELSTDEAGTCHLVLDNLDGWRDQGVAPNTAVRVREIVDGLPRPVFYGVVESGPARWPANGHDAIVELDLADGMSILARGETDIQVPRQLSGNRVAALLDIAGWPAGTRDLDPGVVLVDAVDESGNVLDEIREAARVEDGQIWVASDGTFVFRDRHARLDRSPEATFDIVDATEFAGLDPAYDDGKLWPVARMEMASGEVVEFSDPIGVDLYDSNRVHTVRDLPVSHAEANAFASWIVVRYGQPRRRFSTFTVEAGLSDAATTAVRQLVPGSLIRLRHHPPIGPMVDELIHVEKVAQAVTRSTWTASYELSPYFGAGPWAQWYSDAALAGDGWVSDTATDGAAWAP